MNKANKKYEVLAHYYDILQAPMERLWFKGIRQQAVAMVKGRTLEIGVGSGKNLLYYPSNLELDAIDFSPKMLKAARMKLAGLVRPSTRLRLMDAQHLEYPDNHFDTVLATFVYCTLPDPAVGLREAYRVLAPGGRGVFLEHMRSRHLLMNLMLGMINLVTLPLLGNSMLRPTEQTIARAGFQFFYVQYHFGDVVRLMLVEKPKEKIDRTSLDRIGRGLGFLRMDEIQQTSHWN